MQPSCRGRAQGALWHLDGRRGSQPKYCWQVITVHFGATGNWTSLLRRNAADITSFNLMKVLARQHSLRKSWIPAAGLGSTAGAVLAILQRKPMLPHVAGTAASAAICLGLFGGTTIPPWPFNSNTSSASKSYAPCSALSWLHAALIALELHTMLAS